MRKSLFFTTYSPPVSSLFSAITATGANIKTDSEAEFTHQYSWIKDRDNANDHQWIDSVRGTSAVLKSPSIAAETTYTTPSGNSFAWVWSLPSTGSSNTDGSVTSTVAADTTSGTSVMTYTAGAGNFTFGHGLGVTPDFWFVGRRDGTNRSFNYGHHSTFSSATNSYININSTQAESTAANMWGASGATSTLMGAGSNSHDSGGTYVCWAWATKSGYSKFGTYTGNTTTEPSITGLGATGNAVMIKRTDSTGNWVMIDSARGDNYVYANSTASEGSANYIDFTSDGFDIASGVTNADVNANGATYIYCLWA